jgi:hypothetical protein
LDQVRARQNREMMTLLETEKQNEKDRAESIARTKNEEEK